MFNPSQAFRALSDSKRLRIISLLGQDEVCVCDLMTALKMPQPTVSRHLAYLRGASLVRDRRDGRWRYYSLAKPTGAVHQRLLACVRAYAASGKDCKIDRKRLTPSRVCD
jgi:ArsR family transcriptional regulator